MLSYINQYYEDLEEPNKSCLLALRHIVLNFDDRISECWKYKMPFYCFNGKMFCYFWKDKKTNQPYLGLVKGQHLNHPELEKGDRKKMKVLPIDPLQDLPVQLIREILKESVSFYL